MNWKPSIRDYSKEIANIVLFKNDDDILLKSSNSIQNVKSEIIEKIENHPETDSEKYIQKKNDWEYISKKIYDEKNRYSTILENKRKGIIENVFIKSDINVPYPKLYKRMEAQIYKLNLDQSHHGAWPVDLALAIMLEHLEDTRILIHDDWNSNQRSDSFEKLAKCLDLTQNLQPLRFYASIFIDIIQILDNFSDLVLNRIRYISEKSDGKKSSLDDKYLAMNWIIKAGSTCSIIPRLYILYALMPLEKYLKRFDTNSVILLASQIRGIGNILTATYLRMFYVRCCSIHAPECLSDVSKLFLEDITKSLVKIGWEKDLRTLEPSLSYSDCCDIIEPALKYIMRYALEDAKEKSFIELMKRVGALNSSSILCAAIECLPPSFVSKRSSEFFEYISQYNTKGFSTSKLFAALGEALANCDDQSSDLNILNNCWNIIRKYEKLEEYILCVSPWLSVCIKYYPLNIVDAMLDNTIKHINKESSVGYLDPSDILQIANILFTKFKNINDLLNISNLLPFLQNIRDPSTVVKCCFTFFTCASIRNCKEFNNKSHIYVMLDIFNLCNENYRETYEGNNLNEFENEISSMLQKIHIDVDFDEYLDILTKLRANLYRFENVYYILINKVINIMIKEDAMFLQLRQTETTDKVYSCLTFCLVTILSIINNSRGMQLAIYCAQMSMRYGCIGQAYSFLDLIVTQLEQPTLNIGIGDTGQIISTFLSTILLIPDHPEKETLYFLNKIIQIIENYSNKNKYQLWRATQLSNVVSLLNAYSQKTYIYHLENCKSNCELYMGNVKFNTYLANITETVVKKIDTYLIIGSKESNDQDYLTSISQRLLMCMDINDKNCLNFVSKLNNINLLRYL